MLCMFSQGLLILLAVFDDQIWTVRANVDKYNDSNAHGAVQICHDYGTSYMNRASVSLLRNWSLRSEVMGLISEPSGD